MLCPYCGHDGTKVIDSRETDDSVRRRRECLKCEARFTTHERLEMATLMVVKKDGRREEFHREKLLSGLRKACAKRPVSSEAVEGVAEEIEAELRRQGRAEVASSAIGEMVMERLKALDHIAYIRFASVYRQFTDIGSLKAEVDSLVRQTKPGRVSQLPLLPEEVMPMPRRRVGSRSN